MVTSIGNDLCGYIMVTSWLHHGYIMITSWLHHGYTKHFAEGLVGRWADAATMTSAARKKAARPRVTSGGPAKGKCPARRLNPFRACFCCLFVCVFWGGLGPPKTFPLLFLLFSSLCVCVFFVGGGLSIYSTTNYVRIPSMESALIVWKAIFPYFIIIPLQGRKLVAKFIPRLKIVLAL